MRYSKDGSIIEGGKFQCPQCGSSAFGTTAPDHPDWSTAVGHCHGRCGFKWMRKNDRDVFVPRKCCCAIKMLMTKGCQCGGK